MRARSGLTQKEVASAVGIRERAVYEWENAVRIPLKVLPEIAELFQTSAAYILHGVEPASEELASLRKDVADLRVFISTDLAAYRAQLDELHAALVELAEGVGQVLAVVVKEVLRREEGTRPSGGNPGVDGVDPAPHLTERV